MDQIGIRSNTTGKFDSTVIHDKVYLVRTLNYPLIFVKFGVKGTVRTYVVLYLLLSSIILYYKQTL